MGTRARGVLEVSNFSKGITDHFIPGEESRYQFGDNFDIRDDSKLRSRFGSVPFDLSNSLSRVGTTRLDHLFDHDNGDELLAQEARDINYRSGGSWLDLDGPTGNPSLGAYTNPSITSSSEWRKHTFVTNDAGSSVMKIYRDSGGTLRLTNAGLPELPSSPTLLPAALQTAAETLANDIKAIAIAHLADLTLHASDTSGTLTAVADATDLATLLTLTDALVSELDSHILDSQQVIPVEHVSTSLEVRGLNIRPSNIQSATTLDEAVARLNDLHGKYLWHSWAERTHLLVPSGLHQILTVKIVNTDKPINGPLLKYALDYVNSLRVGYNGHLGDAADHGVVDTVNVAHVPVAATEDEFINLVFNLRIQYEEHFIDSKLAVPVFHTDGTDPSPGTSELAIPNATASSLEGWMAILQEFDDKVLDHARKDSPPHVSADLDNFAILPKKPTITSVVYAFHYQYEYTVNGLTFIDNGPVLLCPAVETSQNDILPENEAGIFNDPNLFTKRFFPLVDSIDITNIPVLSNGSTDNWDTAVIKVKIYRTTDDGQVLFFVGEVTNGTTTFSDFTNDTIAEAGDDPLRDKTTIYTTGGAIENDPVPTAKSLHIVNNIGYYANIIENGEEFPYRLRQSIPGDPDGTPGAFFDDFEEDLNLVSSAGRNVVVFSENSVWRSEGQFNELGQGFMRHEVLSDEVGCIAPGGVLRLNGLVYFPGTDGFYTTNGFQVVKISIGLDDTYREMTKTSDQRKRIRVSYDQVEKRIWWSIQSSSSGSEADKIFVYNTATGGFTTYSNALHFQPTSIVNFGDRILRGDSRGYILDHDRVSLTDPLIDTAIAEANWGEVHIPWDFTSLATDYGSAQVRKYVTKFQLSAIYETNLSLDIVSINDDGRNTLSLKPILQNTVVDLIDEKRRFPSGSLRCDYKAIQLKNAFTEIQKSDNDGLTARSVTGAGTFTVTLTPIGAATWDAKPHEYQIFFVDDNYTQGFRILSRTSDTVLVVDDPSALNPGAGISIKWVIRGFPKDEQLHLIGYNTLFQMMGQTQEDFSGAANEGVGPNV